MKSKITLLPVFVLLFSSLTMLKAQPPQLTADQWKVLMGAVAQENRAIEAEKKPLGRLLTEVAHKDVRPLIFSYIATAPTFTDAVAEIVPLASANKALREESIKALANRIEREATAEQKDVKRYATDLLFEVVNSEKSVPLIAIETLKRAGADVNAKDQRGYTPLLVATEKGNAQIVDALITANADVNAKNTDGETPLIVAARKGYTQIVDALIRAKADVNAKNKNGETPLIVAALEGHKEIVDALIRAKADVNAQGQGGYTPLHWAALAGHKEIVDALIGANADVNAKNQLGDTPLTLAAQYSRKEIVQKLLNTEADKNIKNNQGRTAYDVATDSEIKMLLKIEKKPLLGRLLSGEAHKDVRPLIIGYVATAPTFIGVAKEIVPLAQTNKALREESIKALVKRIEREAVAEQKGVKSYATDLLFKIAKSKEPVPLIAFEALKRANADVNAKDSVGQPPLMWAIFMGRKEIVDALLRANADVNVQDQGGNTPLVLAALAGRKKIVDALIGANADVNAKGEEGRTPLHWAARNGNTQIVDALLRANADVNAQGQHGYTPLTLAAQYSRKDIVQKLLAAGADKKIKNYHGETAYDLATDPEIKKLVQYEE